MVITGRLLMMTDVADAGNGLTRFGLIYNLEMLNQESIAILIVQLRSYSWHHQYSFRQYITG
jgi:hypothetical protein